MFPLGTKSTVIFLLACLQIFGIGLFCKGFFPYKVYLSGYASMDSPHKQPEPQFDRLVFVLIDALRNDFVIGNDSGFDFVNSQIRNGAAYPFTAKATAPTVTLPRIKALTTGTIPSFLDAILNIAESDTSSSLNNHDNWVYQFKHHNNKSIHFFGDDTWMRLFPDVFTKTDGTTSFFVSDTTEVDLNVTRHIQTDLALKDWDAVIFHYLGLDHIGHLGGPTSPLMKPKQKEMDQAIEAMYQIISKQDAERMQTEAHAKSTLMVICGDHGMNQKGNHGGSSEGETSAALVFLSPQFESRPLRSRPKPWHFERPSVLGFPVIDQIDIVPTLATLFGFPVPKNSLGKVILDLYPQDISAVLNAVSLNAVQLGRLLAKLMPEISVYLNSPLDSNDNSTSIGWDYASAVGLHHEYLITKEAATGEDAIILYYKFIEFAQAKLSNTASDYSLRSMIIGVIAICCSAVGFIYLLKSSSFTGTASSDMYKFSRLFALFCCIAYPASMFASSFVEEEHATWYYLMQTMTFLSIIHSIRIPVERWQQKIYPICLNVAQLLLVRLSIAWNHSNLSVKVLSYTGAQWYLMAITLLITVLFGMNALYQLKEDDAFDVHKTVKIIHTLIKIVLFGTLSLLSVLVFIYKIRSAQEDVPRMFMGLLDWELVQLLDQVQLGKLIFNYGGAGLFVLGGLLFVTKRTTSSIGDIEIQDKTKKHLVLQLLLYLVTPLFVLLSGPQSAILFLIFSVQLELLLKWQAYLADKSPVPVWLIAVLITCLSHASFFLTGHSNSIASVDLSNAYVGMQEYDTTLIGLLTFCSNWAASLWWAIAGWCLQSRAEMKEGWSTYIVTHSVLFSAVIASLSISVTVLREHLFIWTVFSPKYLYQIAWTCLFHWCAQVFLGTLIIRAMD